MSKTKAQLERENKKLVDQIHKLRSDNDELKERIRKLRPKITVGGGLVPVCEETKGYFGIKAQLDSDLNLTFMGQRDSSSIFGFDRAQIPDLIRFLNEDVSPLMEDATE
jgi:hypothetical protein